MRIVLPIELLSAYIADYLETGSGLEPVSFLLDFLFLYHHSGCAILDLSIEEKRESQSNTL